MTLLSILLVADFRVREQATRVAVAASPAHVAQNGAEASAQVSLLFAHARDQAMQHAPLTVFLTVAGVLLLFMLRT